MLGLPRNTVRLVPHQSEWVRLFAEEAAQVRAALGAHARRIEHVGSTSVRGLEAKPILDIVVAVKAMEQAEELVPLLAELGYERRPEGDLPSRVFLTKGPAHAITHHLSLTEEGSPTWVDHVDLRDYLRSSISARDEYQALKRRLAASYPEDRRAYTAMKARFIGEMLERARAVAAGFASDAKRSA